MEIGCVRPWRKMRLALLTFVNNYLSPRSAPVGYPWVYALLLWLVVALLISCSLHLFGQGRYMSDSPKIVSQTKITWRLSLLLLLCYVLWLLLSSQQLEPLTLPAYDRAFGSSYVDPNWCLPHYYHLCISTINFINSSHSNFFNIC